MRAVVQGHNFSSSYLLQQPVEVLGWGEGSKLQINALQCCTCHELSEP